MSDTLELSPAEARTARLREAICRCDNKVGRHACDVYAEEASEAIGQLRAGAFSAYAQGPSRKDWGDVVKAIAQELKG